MLNFVYKVMLIIFIVCEQIEQVGMEYSYCVIVQKFSLLFVDVLICMVLFEVVLLIYLCIVYYGDGKFFQVEDCWINLQVVLGVEVIDFQCINVNEWLVWNFLWLCVDMVFFVENVNVWDVWLLEIWQGMVFLIL